MIARLFVAACPFATPRHMHLRISTRRTCVLIALAALPAAGQRAPLRGVVVDATGAGVARATLVVRDQRDSTVTLSDSSGAFRFIAAPMRNAVLRVTRIGFAPVARALTGADFDRPLRIELVAAAATVAGVNVEATRDAERLREAPLSTSTLDATDVTLQTRSTADALDRIAGVRVRQSGGLGSNALISIHGLSGSQIRTFVDGVPQEFLATAGTLPSLSMSALDRIEVYKGVVPLELGGDALGGALNVVTQGGASSAGYVTAGIGSFGRKTADLALRHRGQSWALGFNATHAASRNDYPIDATMLDSANRPISVRVRRFHDRFRVDRFSADGAVLGRRWAEVLRLRGFAASDARELQHAAIMAQPYGKARTTSSSIGGILSWSLAQGAVAASADIGLTHTPSTFVDTTLDVYDWDGSVIRRRDYGGEISTSHSLLDLAADNRLARAGLEWSLPRGTLRLHALHFGVRRSGKDSVANAYYGYDPFQHPSTLDRTVLGAGYDLAAASNRLRATVGVKHYRYTAAGSAIKNSEYVAIDPQRSARNGALGALAWTLRDVLTLKASYELATRMPDAREVLGDYAVVRPNPLLRPEVSHNVNLGTNLGRGATRLDAGLFYRQTSDIVFLRTSQFYSLYQNLLESRSMGAELSAAATLAPWLSVAASGTYQDIRNRSPQGASESVGDRYFNARLPNVPYLFASSQATFGHTTQFWWSTSYVHEFFLHWEVDGRRDTKAVIPTQIVHGAGMTHPLFGDRLRATLDVQNLFDARAYDVFSVPRPGRAIDVQLRATLW